MTTEVSRAAALESFAALRQSMLDVVATFSHEAEISERLLEVLASDVPITDLVARFDVTGERVRLNNVLDTYETRRRQARASLWRIMLAEGCPVGEVSRIFGLSRQLVSRQLKAEEAS